MTVEGGLDEPTELEPEQGSLDLASPEDHWTTADWEKQAAGGAAQDQAARGRRPRRPGVAEAHPHHARRHRRHSRSAPPTSSTTSRPAAGPTRAGAWDIRSHVDAADAAAGQRGALVDLDGGVTSLWLRAGADTDFDHRSSTACSSTSRPSCSTLRRPVAAAERFLAYARRPRAAPPAPTSACAGEADEADLVAVAGLARAAGTLGVVVDATAVHDRGASDAQELGCSMAVGARVPARADRRRPARRRGGRAGGVPLRRDRRAVPDDRQAPGRAPAVGAGARAERGPAVAEQRQHAVTSRPMMSKYDPWVNMLRTTVAAFAAGVGGADAVTVLPFDSPLGRPDAFGRRIARNTSRLLIAESHVARVADPAGGSYAVEKLTDDLARAALGRLRPASRTAPTLDDGDRRDRREARGRDRHAASGRSPGSPSSRTSPRSCPSARPTRAPAEVRRYGASFEALRDEPAASPVFLATLGTVAAAHRARDLRHQPARRRRRRRRRRRSDDGRRGAGRGVRRPAGGLPGRHRRGVRRVGRRGRGRPARRRAPTHVIIAGKPTDYADDSCAMGVDALAFLTRTREELA